MYNWSPGDGGGERGGKGGGEREREISDVNKDIDLENKFASRK